jgi:hypothetical protein
MKANAITTDNRIAQLQQRCEQQRQQLNQHFDAIETQLQTASMMVATLRGAVKNPMMWLSAITGLWAIKRSIQRAGAWSLISRGWMVWSIARKLMKWFRPSNTDRR